MSLNVLFIWMSHAKLSLCSAPTSPNGRRDFFIFFLFFMLRGLGLTLFVAERRRHPLDASVRMGYTSEYKIIQFTSNIFHFEGLALSPRG